MSRPRSSSPTVINGRIQISTYIDEHIAYAILDWLDGTGMNISDLNQKLYCSILEMKDRKDMVFDSIKEVTSGFKEKIDGKGKEVKNINLENALKRKQQLEHVDEQKEKSVVANLSTVVPAPRVLNIKERTERAVEKHLFVIMKDVWYYPEGFEKFDDMKWEDKEGIYSKWFGDMAQIVKMKLLDYDDIEDITYLSSEKFKYHLTEVVFPKIEQNPESYNVPEFAAV